MDTLGWPIIVTTALCAPYLTSCVVNTLDVFSAIGRFRRMVLPDPRDASGETDPIHPMDCGGPYARRGYPPREPGQ